MKIAVVGAGATGAMLGGYLAMAGEDVWLIDPYEAHMKACAEKGLTIKAAGMDATSEIKEYIVPVHATANADIVGVSDLVLFMPKGPFTRAAMANALKVSDDHTVLLTMQNGLGNVEIIEEFFDAKRVACGITSTSSGLPEPGVVTPRHLKDKQIWIGSDRPEMESILMTMINDFRKVGLDANYDANIMIHIWEKFALNCGVNAATSILRLPARKAAEFQDYVDIRYEIIAEIDMVAKKKEIYMDPKVIFSLGSKALPANTTGVLGNYASMAQDAMNKRKTEIDNLNGYIVKEAARLGIRVPFNECITKLVKTIEKNYAIQF